MTINAPILSSSLSLTHTQFLSPSLSLSLSHTHTHLLVPSLIILTKLGLVPKLFRDKVILMMSSFQFSLGFSKYILLLFSHLTMKWQSNPERMYITFKLLLKRVFKILNPCILNYFFYPQSIISAEDSKLYRPLLI